MIYLPDLTERLLILGPVAAMIVCAFLLLPLHKRWSPWAFVACAIIGCALFACAAAWIAQP